MEPPQGMAVTDLLVEELDGRVKAPAGGEGSR